MEFSLAIDRYQRADFEQGFDLGVAQPFEIQWRVSYAPERTRVAILASREDHCLLVLLWRWRRGELEADIALVASNTTVVF